MTGATLLTFVLRRLAEAGVTVSAERTAELYDHITGARDDVHRELVSVAKRIFSTAVTLEQGVADDRLFTLPAATADIIRIVEVRELTTREPYDRSGTLDEDAGDFIWQSARQVRVSDQTDEGDGIVLVAAFMGTAIDANTTEANIGLPTPCHRAIGYGAAVLALTVDEESDASVAAKLYEKELDKLRDQYGEMESQGGEALRHSLMKSIGEQYGDMIY